MKDPNVYPNNALHVFQATPENNFKKKKLNKTLHN